MLFSSFKSEALNNANLVIMDYTSNAIRGVVKGHNGKVEQVLPDYFYFRSHRNKTCEGIDNNLEGYGIHCARTELKFKTLPIDIINHKFILRVEKHPKITSHPTDGSLVGKRKPNVIWQSMNRLAHEDSGSYPALGLQITPVGDSFKLVMGWKNYGETPSGKEDYISKGQTDILSNIVPGQNYDLNISFYPGVDESTGYLKVVSSFTEEPYMPVYSEKVRTYSTKYKWDDKGFIQFGSYWNYDYPNTYGDPLGEFKVHMSEMELRTQDEQGNITKYILNVIPN